MIVETLGPMPIEKALDYLASRQSSERGSEEEVIIIIQRR